MKTIFNLSVVVFCILQTQAIAQTKVRSPLDEIIVRSNLGSALMREANARPWTFDIGGGADNSGGKNSPEKTGQSYRNGEVQRVRMPPSEGIFSTPSGACFQRIVTDNGFTPVTTDAIGNLVRLKNDIVETWPVDCP